MRGEVLEERFQRGEESGSVGCDEGANVWKRTWLLGIVLKRISGGKVLGERYLCRSSGLQRSVMVLESAFSSLREEAEPVWNQRRKPIWKNGNGITLQ